MWFILSVYALLKVVKIHCDLSVLAMSLMGFQKKLDGFELYPICFGILEFA